MLEDLLRWLGMGLCHQLPERSFFGGGVQVPVCARDTGIYVGFTVALAVLARLEKTRRSSETPPWPVIAGIVVAIGLMAIDGLTSYLGMRETTNALRLATGLGAGFGMAGLTFPLVNSQLWRNPGRDRILSGRRDVGVFLGALILSWALSWWVLPAFGIAYPLFVAASIIVTFTAVNLVIVCLLPIFERSATRLRDAWLPLSAALLLTFAELGLSALLRVVLTGAASVGLRVAGA